MTLTLRTGMVYLAARTLLPFIEENDLSPDMAGIRPKLQTGGESFRDFVIRDESDKGLPGFINLIGIESRDLLRLWQLRSMLRS